ERVGVAQVGQSKLRLAQAKRYAREHGRWDDPVVRGRFADLESALLAVELTSLRVAAESADGRPDPASSVLKPRGTELQQRVAELVVDLAGPASVLAGGQEPAVTRWARRATASHLNARKVTIYGGSSEIQRGIIASGVLGL